MGLFSRVSEEQAKENTKSLSVEKKTFNTFKDLCKYFCISHGALLKLIDNEFAITNYVGLDLETVALLTSFENYNLYIENDIKTFSLEDNSLQEVNSFVSEKMKESIFAVHFIKIDTKNIFIKIDYGKEETKLNTNELIYSLQKLINEPVTIQEDKLVFNFEKEIMANKAHLLILNVKDAILSTLKVANINSEKVINIVFSAIFDELFNQVHHFFSFPNVCCKDNDKIKIIIFAHNNFDEKLLQYHIAKKIDFLFGKSSSLLLIEKVNTVSSQEEINNFIEQ